jgi:hypothetical protein
MCDVFFDKCFVAMSVVFRDTSEQDTADFVAQVVLHAACLLPALATLGDTSDALRLSESVAASVQEKKIRAEARRRKDQKQRAKLESQMHVRRLSLSQCADITTSARAATANAATANSAAENSATVSAAAANGALLSNKRCGQTLGIATGVAMVLAGVGLMAVVAAAFTAHRSACVGFLGDLEPCAGPQQYYVDGLFGLSGTCPLERFKYIDCAAAGITYIPESPEGYAQMTNLVTIDVSRNANLERIPDSWSRIPGLERLLLTGLEHGVNLPYTLCDKAEPISSTLLEMKLDDNDGMLGREVDWTGIFSASGRGLDLSDVCQAALRDRTVRMFLPENRFFCMNQSIASLGGLESTRYRALYEEQVDKIAVLGSFSTLSYLDLRANCLPQVDELGILATKALRGVVVKNGSGGLDLTENPLTSGYAGVMGLEAAHSWMQIFSRAGDHLDTVTIGQSALLSPPWQYFTSNAMPLLRHLSFSGNKITGMTAVPAALASLAHLDFSQNYLGATDGFLGASTPSDVFAELTSLRVLNLGSNDLTRIQVSLLPPSLEDLRLNQNLLRHTHVRWHEVMDGLPKLNLISLSRNPAPIDLSESVSPRGLSSHLEYFTCQRCELDNSRLGPGGTAFFFNLTNLKRLVLPGNALRHVDFLSRLTGLEEVELDANNVSARVFAHLARMPRLKVLTLHDNPRLRGVVNASMIPETVEILGVSTSQLANATRFRESMRARGTRVEEFVDRQEEEEDEGHSQSGSASADDIIRLESATQDGTGVGPNTNPFAWGICHLSLDQLLVGAPI